MFYYTMLFVSVNISSISFWYSHRFCFLYSLWIIFCGRLPNNDDEAWRWLFSFGSIVEIRFLLHLKCQHRDTPSTTNVQNNSFWPFSDDVVICSSINVHWWVSSCKFSPQHILEIVCSSIDFYFANEFDLQNLQTKVMHLKNNGCQINPTWSRNNDVRNNVIPVCQSGDR